MQIYAFSSLTLLSDPPSNGLSAGCTRVRGSPGANLTRAPINELFADGGAFARRATRFSRYICLSSV